MFLYFLLIHSKLANDKDRLCQFYRFFSRRFPVSVFFLKTPYIRLRTGVKDKDRHLNNMYDSNDQFNFMEDQDKSLQLYLEVDCLEESGVDFRSPIAVAV